MTKRMDWNKARKFTAREEKYATGTVLDNGRVVVNAPRDSLAARAAKAEREWERQQAAKRRKALVFVKRAQKAGRS